ncbi:MAG: ATP-grasp domain-containing protein [Clostridiaceae bacterium]|nr:ATP-grasp domain-containing protein [Clostridiaceae bacterium]
MQLTGWLVYSKEDYERNSSFAKRFLKSGNNKKSSIKLVFKDDIYFGVFRNTLCLLDKVRNILPTPDFVINRSIDPLFSRHLENMNIKVFNSSRISEICNDKARTYLEVSRLGIPMVDTLFINKNTLLQGNFSFEYPVVIKTVDGRSGKEVFLAQSRDDVLNIVSSIPKDRFVAQKLCKNPGRDVRVFVVGKDIVGAVLRQSNVDFKANISLGGSAEAYHLNEVEKGYVKKIVEHFDFGMVGIDFIFDEKGHFLFNEIEDVAGCRTLYMTSNVDIVKLYLEHIYDVFKRENF